jgi:hypothetical protein
MITLKKSTQGLGTRASMHTFGDKAHIFTLGGTQQVPGKPQNDEYWLERAQEAFTQANRMTQPEAKRMMLEIAAGYQRLAQLTEERTGRNKPRLS